MALTGIARAGGYINKRGSAYWAGSEVDADGTDMTVADTLHNFGFAQTFNYNREATAENEVDVGGTNHLVGSTTEATLETKVMQRDVGHIELPKTHTLTPTRIYAEMQQSKLGTGGDKGQILVICNAQLPDALAVNMEDLFPTWNWTCYPNSSGAPIVVDLTDFTGSLGAGVGNATIAAGEYEDIAEFTYA